VITHAESGKSMIGKQPRSTRQTASTANSSTVRRLRAARMFPIPVLRYMKTHGITHEQIASVAVVRGMGRENIRRAP